MIRRAPPVDLKSRVSRAPGNGWPLRAVLAEVQDAIAPVAGDAAGQEARFLVAHAAGCEPARLFTLDTISDRSLAALSKRVTSRRAGVPLQYVLGEWDFHGLTFDVRAGVLIPRSDTEALVEAVTGRLPPGASGPALDLGTGTGILAVTLKRLRPRLAMQAWDVDPAAVRLARRNAARHEVDVDVRLADLATASVPAGLTLVVSNPPYIPSAAIAALDPQVQDHEPHRALDGGPDGLDFYRRILDRFWPALTAGGLLAMEIGFDQGPAVLDLARAAGASHPELVQDLAGRDRVAVMSR